MSPERGAAASLAEWRGKADYLLNRADLAALPRMQALLVGILRGLGGIIREATEGQLTLRAMSLVYTTLLSVVPLLALSFSVLKAFGAHNAVEPLMLGLLEPLGEQGVEITDNVLSFVDNMRVGVLGFIGLIFLVYTVIALVQKIELAFNSIWHIEGTRSLSQRFSNYLSVIMIGPLLVVSALGVTATVMSSTLMQRVTAVEPIGSLFAVASNLLPFALIVAAFTFIYVFVPNTRVRLVPAIIGAVIAGVLWQAAGWGFAALVAGSTRYDAIYSGFAIMIMLLIWLYLAWLILLIGSNIAFYIQHPEYMRVRGAGMQVSGAMRERLGLHLMAQVGARFLSGEKAPSLDEIAYRLQVPSRALVGAASALTRAGLLVVTGDDDPRYLPGRDLAEIQVNQILTALREGEDVARYQRLAGIPAVEDAVARVERSRAQALESATLRDLLTQQTDAVAARSAG
ncbi:YhjD/YihY/BrkB family envelope integrity protein [Thioalkalivibrio paradoxus]|uniref:Ribonuclease BN n=1 Tax=Thioalkalivibrio paradoxus ARh 1 TaxID=713585 RepID=W0DH32_9GAMM|nr:YhjD/YihY/BrkB family envelope integrity protein [Thioalkalivibrio paradoxus]AHE97944.1 ribonuclease BN [Thioalkalivibrio paradoxus ARh 1]